MDPASHRLTKKEQILGLVQACWLHNMYTFLVSFL